MCLLGKISRFFEKNFRNTIRVSNSLDPYQAWHFVRSDVGPNRLQKLSAVSEPSSWVQAVKALCPGSYEHHWLDIQYVPQYSKFSEISNTSSLPKRHRQTVQTQIRVFPVCYSDKYFVNYQHFIWEQKDFRKFTLTKLSCAGK